jgi:Ser/Thr protein kinase RdoA (MazF antagonist)
VTNTIESHPRAETFNSLSPEQVLDAVEAGELRCTGRFLILNSFENRVYQLELSDGRMVVGKFYRPGRWSETAIQAEHDFLLELQAEEIPVSVPIDLGDGRTQGMVGDIRYALFERVGGRAPEEPSDQQMQVLGRLIARIHNVGARAEAPERGTLTPASYGADNLAYLLEHDCIPVEARDIYAATVNALLDRIEPYFRDVPMHRIHGDCHLNNLLMTQAGPTFLDFDDFLSGPAVQDLWLLAGSGDQEGRIQRDMLAEAYAEMREFSPAWLKLVEPLRALRFIRYSTWIARRWDDPAFKHTFSHFGSLMYWQRETSDLREQIARIDHELL